MSNAIFVERGGGFSIVSSVGASEAAEPRSGEITVRLHASSLNYHDDVVVSGIWGPSERRIPMSDGAGEVAAVGPDDDRVRGWRPCRQGTFFPTWLDGAPIVDNFATVPGDGVDGYARTIVTRPATAFTHAPRGYSHEQAATLTDRALTAWRALHVDDALKAGDVVLSRERAECRCLGCNLRKWPARPSSQPPQVIKSWSG